MTGLKRFAALFIGPIGYTLAMPWPMARHAMQKVTKSVHSPAQIAFLFLLFGPLVAALSPIIAFMGGLAEGIFYPHLVYDRLSGTINEDDGPKNQLKQAHEIFFGLAYAAVITLSVLAGTGTFNVLGHIVPFITLHFKYHLLMLLVHALPASGAALAFATLGVGFVLALAISLVVMGGSFIFKMCVPTTETLNDEAAEPLEPEFVETAQQAGSIPVENKKGQVVGLKFYPPPKRGTFPKAQGADDKDAIPLTALDTNKEAPATEEANIVPFSFDPVIGEGRVSTVDEKADKAEQPKFETREIQAAFNASTSRYRYINDEDYEQYVRYYADFLQPGDRILRFDPEVNQHVIVREFTEADKAAADNFYGC